MSHFFKHIDQSQKSSKCSKEPSTSMYLHVPLRTYMYTHIYIYYYIYIHKIYIINYIYTQYVPTYHIFPPAILPASPGIEATLHGVPTTPCAEEAATLWCENLGTPHQSSKRFQKTTVKPKLYDWCINFTRLIYSIILWNKQIPPTENSGHLSQLMRLERKRPTSFPKHLPVVKSAVLFCGKPLGYPLVI